MIETIETVYGQVAIFDTDTTQYPWLKSSGAPVEDRYIEIVRQLLRERPRGDFIDVGASFGCWSLALAEDVESILAIEPQTMVCELLLRTVALNLAPGKALVLNCAAWDRDAILRLPPIDYGRPDNFGGMMLSHHDGLPVTACPLDRIVGDRDIALIKIDVEGSERQVLLGARETIRRCRPILFVENDHPRTHKEGLRQLLDSYSYALEEQGGNYLGVPL